MSQEKKYFEQNVFLLCVRLRANRYFNSQPQEIKKHKEATNTATWENKHMKAIQYFSTGVAMNWKWYKRSKKADKTNFPANTSCITQSLRRTEANAPSRRSQRESYSVGVVAILLRKLFFVRKTIIREVKPYSFSEYWKIQLVLADGNRNLTF